MFNALENPITDDNDVGSQREHVLHQQFLLTE